MDKFDTIYADSINSDIEFDVIFGSDGELIEAVDPKHFFDNDGSDKFDVVKESKTIHANISEDLDSYVESMEDEGDPGDESDDDLDLEEGSCSESDEEEYDDNDEDDDEDDDYEEYDDDEEDLDESDVTSWYNDEPYYGHQDDDPHDGVHSHTHCHGDFCHNHPHSHDEDHYDHHHHEPGDGHHPEMYHGHRADHQCDHGHHDDYYGQHHNYDRDDWHDKEKYHDHNDKEYFTLQKPEYKEPITVDDLDNQVARYDMETRDYEKQAIHAGCAKETTTTDDLDKYLSFKEEEDGDLIDKVDHDGPDEEATPADFQIPSDQQTNKFEVDRKLKEATTSNELDDAVVGLIGLGGTSSLGYNIGLETEESECPGSNESLEDGEDIDSIMGEGFDLGSFF